MEPDLVASLVKTIELKDLSTAAHSWRVVLYARAMAEELGLDHETIRRVTAAAALHDVGKIDIPDQILQKPGKLTDEEFDVIKSHTTLGHERLVRMGEEDEIMLNLVRHHHERWDGKGYPDGLAGDRIPLGPRLFAVIDSFDALTSVRPYRREVGEEAANSALVEIEAGKGTRYQPEMAELFARLYRTGKIDWILHYFNDESPIPGFSMTDEADRIAGKARRPEG
ncbi:MAG: HD-GYP domain-containing protein [Planctomycetota bacterium]|nr:HD-GYP domain-containing protein [Planctomycetota bacterium]